MKRIFLGAALLAAGQAQAFCEAGILQTDVLCLTAEVEEIKLCRTTHPETGGDVLALHVDPAVSDGPMISVVEEIPVSMRLGTGGFPWDSYGLSFLHEGGRATLHLKRGIDAADNEGVEIALSLYGRGAEPQRTLSCLVPPLRAEVDMLLAVRGVAPNAHRTGPSAESLPFYTPRQPIMGDTPHGGYSCREMALTPGNAGSDAGQVALYTAPFDAAAVMGYAAAFEVGGAFECWKENGFSAIVWPDADKRGDGDPWSMLEFEARMAACGLDAAHWPPNMPYFGNCSSAWDKSVNVSGFGG